MAFETDSYDYDILYRAAQFIKDVPGIVCEIGTRRGGSMKYIIDGLLSVGDNNRNVLCIDPYGGVTYYYHEDHEAPVTDYTNDMRNTAMVNLYSYIDKKPINLVLMCMEDTEFFARFADGVPFYQGVFRKYIDNVPYEEGTKTISNQYSLVFFDGPHTTELVLNEVKFFIPRSVIGTRFVFDDCADYNHQVVHNYLLENNFEIVEQKHKFSYIKVK